MEVTVKTQKGSLRFNSGVLDVAVLVASAFGFNLDIEPMSGSAKLTATNYRTGAIVRASGHSVTNAAEKLINLLTEG